jgi:hypothetical protein
MKYYLLYSFALLSCLLTAAQNNVEKVPDIEDKTNSRLKFSFIEAGPYLAIPVNESFISNSDYELGFELSSSLIFMDQLQVGVGYNQFNLKNHDFSRTGYQGKTRNSAIYLQLGYQYRFSNKTTASINYSVGQAVYKHALFDSTEDFKDRAFYNSLTLKYTYTLGKFTALNIYAGYRIDFLDVEVPEQLSNLYDNASYFNTGLSLSIFFY